MQFFKDFYKYDDIIEAPEYGSTEYEQENKRVEILGKQYDDYLKGIKKHLPRNFFDVYYKYSQNSTRLNPNLEIDCIYNTHQKSFEEDVF